MKNSNQLALFGMLSVVSLAAAAADGTNPKPVDTSQWKCESCPFEKGTSGTVDVGAGSVSEKSAKFGEYNGLKKKGEHFVGDGAARFRGTDGNYWNLDASNLGLDTRALDAEGGQQGKYKLRLKYDELPHNLSDTVSTPFIGSGSGSLTLPAGFAASTTAGMAPGSLQQFDLGTRRKRLGVGASWTPVTSWEYALNFRHQTKEGTKRSAGAFFVNSSQLIEPVDYATDQIDASASYSDRKLQLKFGYYGSIFKNSIDSLSWANPYGTTGPGSFLQQFPNAATGQLALPPDNQFHQVLASAGYQLSDRTRASADFAIGRMTQNDSFLQYGTTVAGPGGSLNGRVETLDANLKLSSAVTDRLRLNAAYAHNDRDNKTPQSLYQVFTTDMFAGAPRINLPYSFTQDKVKLSGDYKATASIRASAGFDYDTHKRTFLEADRTHENTAWGKVSSHISEKVDLTFKYAHASRRNSGYQVVPAITPPENPLLRKYNMADRTRQTTGLRMDIAATENVNVGLGLDISKDDYDASTIGLQSGRDVSLNGDVSWIITPETSMHVFGGHQEIKSTQAGSEAFSTADWTGKNYDKVDFVGLGVKHAAIKDKLDIGADFTVTRSRGEISVSTGASNPGFPDLRTSLDSLRFYANYKLNDKTSLIGSYWFEQYDSKNWMLDGVTFNTIPNVLTFGEQAPHYRVHVLRVALRHKF